MSPWAMTWDGSTFASSILRFASSQRIALTKYSLSCNTITLFSSSKDSTCANAPNTPGSVSIGFLSTEDNELFIQHESIVFE